MFELTQPQMFFYSFSKRGIGQTSVLCGSITLPRLIDEAVLQKAANEVCRINNGIRSYFIERDGKVYQDFAPFKERVFEVLRFNSRQELDDWAGMYATIPLKLDIRREGRKATKEKGDTPQNVSPVLMKNILLHNAHTSIKRARHHIKVTPTCCEIKLVYLPDACGAVIKIHHVVSDAWTILLLANQFVRLINGETPTAYQYEEYLESEKAYRSSKRYEKDAVYFRQLSERCPEHTRVWPNAMTTLEAKRRTVTLSRGETARIRAYAASHNVSAYHLFLTAASIFVGRKLKRDQFFVGSVVLNRTGIRQRSTAGLFICSVPVLVELDRKASFANTVQQIENENYASFRHAKGPRVGTGDNPLYDLWVSYQNATLEADNAGDCTQYFCNYTPTLLSVLTIEDRAREGRFKLHFDHNILITESEVDELFDVMLSVLRDGIADNTEKIEALGT